MSWKEGIFIIAFDAALLAFFVWYLWVGYIVFQKGPEERRKARANYSNRK